MRHRSSLLRALLVLALLGAGVPRAGAADRLDVMVEEWNTVVRLRTDEQGWQEQEALLNRIADLKTKESQRALKKMRDKRERPNRRRTGLILAAMLRHATPDQLDEILRWVEQKRDPFLMEGLAPRLAKVTAPATREHLRGKALRRAAPPTKAQIVRSLGLAKDRDAKPVLTALLDERNIEVRIEAIDALSAYGDPGCSPPVLALLEDDEPRVRDAAARALGTMDGECAVMPLIGALYDEAYPVIESAALALGNLRDPRAIQPLITRLEKLQERDLRVADALAKGLEEITGRALGIAPEPWQDWWDAVKERPWVRHEPGEPGTGGHTVPGTRYYGFPIRSSRLVFVIDISRSMGWSDRLERAKRELVAVLEEMPGRTRFNIVAFSDQASPWKQKLQPASRAKIRSAIKFVQRLGPQNGTNTWGALMQALKDEDVDTIFFLSDGHPSVGSIVDTDLIRARLRRMNRYRRVRIHCVALMQGGPPLGHAGVEDARRAEAFMRSLAEDHDGEFQAVR